MNIFGLSLVSIFGIDDIIVGMLNFGSQQQATNAQERIANENLEFQKEQYAYQKELQNTMFAREDSAVQRKVKDLEAAGINPILAAGQGAEAGPVVSTQAPERDSTAAAMRMNMAQNLTAMYSNMTNGIVNLMKARADIHQTEAETELLRTDKSLKDLDISYYERKYGDKQWNDYQRTLAIQANAATQRNMYVLSRNRTLWEKTLAQNADDREEYLKDLKRQGLSIDVARKALDMGMDYHDFMVSLQAGLRRSDSLPTDEYAATLGLPGLINLRESSTRKPRYFGSMTDEVIDRLLKKAMDTLDYGVK